MDWNEYFFRHVFLAASKSKDSSSRIGAVIVKDGMVVSEGYNGFPREVLELPERTDNRDMKLTYTVHGEHNSILNCARVGISTVGATMFTNAFPCDQCMKAIIQAGIKHIVVHAGAHELFYRRASTSNWHASHDNSKLMAQEAGVQVDYWEGNLGLEVLVGGVLHKI